MARERHTALIDSLASTLFPFQESEEEQESFTAEGRKRVDAWLTALLNADAPALAALRALWCDDRVQVALGGNPNHIKRVSAQVEAAVTPTQAQK